MQRKVKEYFIATHNILLFLLHFFSVTFLLKSLFEPWKNIYEDESDAGGSHTWFDRFTFNAISRTLGFCLRGSLLVAFVIVISLYFLFLPMATLLFLLLLPALYLESLIPPSDEALKQSFHDAFMKDHATGADRAAVEKWFDFYYDRFLRKRPWWGLAELLKIQPLGYDWSTGFTIHINQFGTDLLTTNPLVLIGREEEIEELSRALMKESGANVVLVGEDGVGKRSVIYELARRSHDGLLVKQLNYLRFIHLDLEKVLAQYQTTAQQENFFTELLKEGERAKNIVLVIDNLDRYIESADGMVSLYSSIQKVASHNTVRLITTTTPHRYEKSVRSRSGLAELFTTYTLAEPSREENVQIVAQRALSFEKRYSCIVPYQIVELCVEKSDYYVSDLPFPLKAIRLLEDACIGAAEQHNATITLQHLEQALSRETKAPTTIDDNLRNRLLNLERELQKRVLHQDRAIAQLSSSLRSAFVMLGKRSKPLATALFTGPTGTGKTETVKALTETVFGPTEHKLIRFDMAEYQLPESIPQLIGSDRTDHPGLLTEAVEQNPYATLLLDEIEKAHHDLLNLFLTILDEGYFTNGSGRRVDCKHLIIIATSNVQDVERVFSPEFLNRFDGIIPFSPLRQEDVIDIARLYTASLISNYQKAHGIRVSVTDEYLKSVISTQYNPTYGARDVQRILSANIDGIIAKKLLAKELHPGDTITL